MGIDQDGSISIPKNIILAGQQTAGCATIDTFLNPGDKTSTPEKKASVQKKPPVNEDFLLNGIQPKLDTTGKYLLTKETARAKLEFKGIVADRVYIISNKYVLVRFLNGILGAYSAKNLKEIKTIDFKNARINCMTANDHKIYMVVDNLYIHVYQTSNFKHLDTIQVYGQLQHCTLTDREDHLLSIY